MTELVEMKYTVCIPPENHRNFSLHLPKGANTLVQITVTPAEAVRQGGREGTFQNLQGL